MISTVLGPATVLLMIIGAFNACFGMFKKEFFLIPLDNECCA
jgi:hypothetical protein